MSENMKKVIPKCYIYGLEKTKVCRQCRKPLKLVQILYSKEDIGTSNLIQHDIAKIVMYIT